MGEASGPEAIGCDNGEGFVILLLASDEARGGMLTSFASCLAMDVPCNTVGLEGATSTGSRLVYDLRISATLHTKATFTVISRSRTGNGTALDL